MAFLRSGCVTILVCAGVSGAIAAERIRTGVQVAETQPPAAAPASPIILSSPPAEGSFALPADWVETPATPAGAQAPAAARPAIAAPAQAAAPAMALKKPPAALQFATISKDPHPTLDPGTFVNTMRAAERYHAIASVGGWGTLPKGAPLKLGDKGQLVVKLKERLAATNDLARDSLAGEAFDSAVLASVKRFQGRHGLPETGFVGPRTIDALNVPADVRARQLSGSAQRLAGTRFPFGERYVVVNIPAATVEAVDKGQVARRYVAVVGKKERPSPAVMAPHPIDQLQPDLDGAGIDHQKGCHPAYAQGCRLPRPDEDPHPRRPRPRARPGDDRLGDREGRRLHATPGCRDGELARPDSHRHAEPARRLHARHADEEALCPRRPLPFLRLRAGRQRQAARRVDPPGNARAGRRRSVVAARDRGRDRRRQAPGRGAEEARAGRLCLHDRLCDPGRHGAFPRRRLRPRRGSAAAAALADDRGPHHLLDRETELLRRLRLSDRRGPLTTGRVCAISGAPPTTERR